MPGCWICVGSGPGLPGCWVCSRAQQSCRELGQSQVAWALLVPSLPAQCPSRTQWQSPPADSQLLSFPKERSIMLRRTQAFWFELAEAPCAAVCTVCGSVELLLLFLDGGLLLDLCDAFVVVAVNNIHWERAASDPNFMTKRNACARKTTLCCMGWY